MAFTIDGQPVDDNGGQVVYRRYRDGREEWFPKDEEPTGTKLFYTTEVSNG